MAIVMAYLLLLSYILFVVTHNLWFEIHLVSLFDSQ